MTTPSLPHSPAWQALVAHHARLRATKLATIIAEDPQRMTSCDLRVGGMRLNYGLNFVTMETMGLLESLARQQQVESWRDRMVGGEKINDTENRAVLHMALRQRHDRPVYVDGRDVVPDIRAARQQMGEVVEDVRAGRWLGASGKPIRHVVNIGIGGSDLGPRLVAQALAEKISGPAVHFVANADAFALHSVIRNLDPAETLFIVVSKTFTTQETLLNAKTARAWIADALGANAVARHFIAVSINNVAAQEFGIPRESVLPIWDWVGGRFSLWSAVGISIAMAVGMETFQALCGGAAAMDDHFLTAPLSVNMPVVWALLAVWNQDFCGAEASALLPYSERLRELPRYVQQLEMESNGKSVTRDNVVADYPTAPIVFGEAGTVGQHGFHQWLHQGSRMIASDFIGVAEDDLAQPNHHRAMLSNMVAQMGALAFGQDAGLSPRDDYAGGRPSNLVLLDRLDPHHVGMLLALFEHKVFVEGVIWNINSFDQPGVELGKRLARSLASDSTADDFTSRIMRDLYNSFGHVNL